MRILVLSQWYTPEPIPKVHVLAKELVAHGHTVTVITGFPNYPNGRIFAGYRIRWRQWEFQDGVRILRLPLYPDHSLSSTKRSLNYLSFALSASTLGALLCKSADVMWVYCAPLTTGLPAWWIGLLRRIPFVFNIHDMWPETLSSTDMLQSSRLIRWLNYMAGFIYQRSSAITVVSPGFQRNLVAKQVPPDRIHVIPNWADEDVYRPMPQDEALALKYGLAGRFNVMYGGNMGAAQMLTNVLDAAALLMDYPDVQFVLIGAGIEVSALMQTARLRSLTNVRFIEQQPDALMPQFFAWADALLVHLKRDPLFEITIPSKTTAYLACGRPIITCTAGDAADVVREAGAGLVCPPEDPVALAQAVRNLYAMSAEQREKLGQAGRRAFLTQYTRAALVHKYEILLTEVAEQYKKGKR